MSHMTAPGALSCVWARLREAVRCLLASVSFPPRVDLGELRRALGPWTEGSVGLCSRGIAGLLVPPCRQEGTKKLLAGAQEGT